MKSCTRILSFLLQPWTPHPVSHPKHPLHTLTSILRHAVWKIFPCCIKISFPAVPSIQSKTRLNKRWSIPLHALLASKTVYKARDHIPGTHWLKIAAISILSKVNLWLLLTKKYSSQLVKLPVYMTLNTFPEQLHGPLHNRNLWPSYVYGLLTTIHTFPEQLYLKA